MVRVDRKDTKKKKINAKKQEVRPGSLNLPYVLTTTDLFDLCGVANIPRSSLSTERRATRGNYNKMCVCGRRGVYLHARRHPVHRTCGACWLCHAGRLRISMKSHMLGSSSTTQQLTFQTHVKSYLAFTSEPNTARYGRLWWRLV